MIFAKSSINSNVQDVKPCPFEWLAAVCRLGPRWFVLSSLDGGPKLGPKDLEPMWSPHHRMLLELLAFLAFRVKFGEMSCRFFPHSYMLQRNSGEMAVWTSLRMASGADTWGLCSTTGGSLLGQRPKCFWDCRDARWSSQNALLC